jgi:hypothetical protein
LNPFSWHSTSRTEPGNPRRQQCCGLIEGQSNDIGVRANQLHHERAGDSCTA